MNWSDHRGVHFNALLVIVGVIFAALVGWLRYLTGPEWALSLFYLIPISIVTWKAGRWAGILISFCSAISWLAADIMMLDTFSKKIIPFLNETFRLAVFLIITFCLSALRKALNTHKELSRTDSLTGIENRRAFFDLASKELDKARRFHYPISLLYIDLDDFKQINDLFGHHVGDDLLCMVARLIKSNIRSFDIVARLGGDEFCVLLIASEAEPAHSVAEKIQKLIVDLMSKREWSMTLSIGVATFRCLPESVSDMLKVGDSLMYSAKVKGKNMIQQNIIGK